jgi:hypothetical protein
MIRKFFTLLVSPTLVTALFSVDPQAEKDDKQGSRVWGFKIVNYLTINLC